MTRLSICLLQADKGHDTQTVRWLFGGLHEDMKDELLILGDNHTPIN